MRKFDLIPKTSIKDFDVRTNIGGVFSIGFLLGMGLVLFVEYQYWKRNPSDLKQQAILNNQRGNEEKPVNIFMNLTIGYPCQLLKVSIHDFSENHQLNSVSRLQRQRLDENFKPLGPPMRDDDPRSLYNQCGNCLGSNYTKCCMTCFDIASSFKLQNQLVPNLDNVEQCIRDMKAIQDKETCRIVGDIATQFTNGELLINAGGDLQLPVHFKYDLSYFGDNANLSHWISTLRFGPYFPGLVNPLDNAHWVQRGRGFYYYKYRLNLVPTKVNVDGKEFESSQYSASFSSRQITKIVSKSHPAIAFAYNTAPFIVGATKESTSIVQLITHICAIIGGGFTMAGLASSFFFKISPKRD